MPADAVTQTSTISTNPNTNSVPNKPKPKRIERDLDKMQKLLNIVLKIALRNGYNEEFTINDRFGNPISDTDIAALLNNALSHEKILVGEKDFIRLLYESNVNPYCIVNETVRAKLLSYRPTGPQNAPTNGPPKTPSPTIQIRSVSPTAPMPLEIPETPPERIRSAKRKLFNTEGERHLDEELRDQMETGATSAKTKPINAWEVPLPTEEDDDL